MEKSNGRIAHFDTAKAYLIFLVILGHILIVLNPGYDKLHLTIVQVFIYVFHMPSFFIIHGILFNNEKWKAITAKEFIFKRLYTLIVPYIFFEGIGIVWKAIFVKQDVLTGLYNMLTVRCNVGADWFLPALFMGSFLYLIYVKHPNYIYGVISAIVSFILPMFMADSQITIVIGRALLAYGFIMIGHMGKTSFKSEKTKNVIFILAALLVTGIIAIISLKWAGNDFYGCIVKNPITFVIGGISGTYLMLGVSQYLYSDIISYIGTNTLIIMGTHQLVIYALTTLMPELQGGRISAGIVLLAVIILFEIVVVYLMNKYLPFFIGKEKSEPKIGY